MAAPMGPVQKTAFVLAGGGSLGAVQVGMLKALAEESVSADMVVGSSVGSINGAYYAARPDRDGVAELERLWVTTKRSDIFPFGFRTLTRVIAKRDFLLSGDGLISLIERNLPYSKIENARIALHIVTTDFLSGEVVVHSSGPAARAIAASCAIPAAFPTMEINGRHLADGGLASNTPVKIAVQRGARRLIVLPTGYSCALRKPPQGAIASALHGISLLTTGQIVNELEVISEEIEYHVVPSLCPVTTSAYDFSQTRILIERAAIQTRQWLADGGLTKREIPDTLRPHNH